MIIIDVQKTMRSREVAIDMYNAFVKNKTIQEIWLFKGSRRINPDNTTFCYFFVNAARLCIAYKSIFEILITQPFQEYPPLIMSCVLHTKVSLKS